MAGMSAAEHEAEIEAAIHEKRSPKGATIDWLWDGSPGERKRATRHNKRYWRREFDAFEEAMGVKMRLQSRHEYQQKIDQEVEDTMTEAAEAAKNMMTRLRVPAPEQAKHQKQLRDNLERLLCTTGLARSKAMYQVDKLREMLGGPRAPEVEPEPPEQPSEYRVQKQREDWGLPDPKGRLGTKARARRSRVARKQAESKWRTIGDLEDLRSEAQQWNDDLTPQMKAAGLGDRRAKNAED